MILDKIIYVSKMDGILQDSDKFVPNNEDWFKVIIQHEDRINRFFSGLLQDSIIDKNLYDHLRIKTVFLCAQFFHPLELVDMVLLNFLFLI